MLFRFVLLTLICLEGVVYPSAAQTDVKEDSTINRSDKGHWLALLAGTITNKADLEDPWTISGGYEWRFANNWSIPLSFEMFRYDNTTEIRYGFDAALKVRVVILQPMTGVYAQMGMGGINGVFGIPIHYAVGIELGLFDRLGLYGQAKKFISLEDGGLFLSLGISINVTSQSLRQRHDLQE